MGKLKGSCEVNAVAQLGVGGFSYLDEDLQRGHFTTSLLPHTPHPFNSTTHTQPLIWCISTFIWLYKLRLGCHMSCYVQKMQWPQKKRKGYFYDNLPSPLRGIRQRCSAASVVIWGWNCPLLPFQKVCKVPLMELSWCSPIRSCLLWAAEGGEGQIRCNWKIPSTILPSEANIHLGGIPLLPIICLWYRNYSIRQSV